MKTKIIIAACLISQLTWAQSEQKKSLPAFTQVNANVSTTVYLQKSSEPFISMKQDSGASDIKAEVVNGTLMLRAGKSGEVPAKITIGYVDLNVIEGNGAVSIKSAEVISATNFEINLNGA